MEPAKPEAELQELYHRVLRPLSLFPREATVPDRQKRPAEEPPTLLSLPVSRLTAESLCRKVAQRLDGCRLAVRVPPEGRCCFTKVILDELKCSWQEPPSHPRLSLLDNQRLWNRLQAHVLLSSEQLFRSYLNRLVDVPRTQGVFTESAMLTRLAAGLARDCSSFLTSPSVYRALRADFLAQLKAERAQGGLRRLRTQGPTGTGTLQLYAIPLPHSSDLAQVPPSSLNLNYLIQLSRPPEPASEPEPDPVKELKSIPQLRKRKAFGRLPSRQMEKGRDGASQSLSPPKHFVAAAPSRRASTASPSAPCSQLGKGQSMPSLREGWRLADELGLPRLPPRPLTPLILVPESKPELEVNTVAEDLKGMVKKMKLERSRYSPRQPGLPPLVGALTHCPTARGRVEELQRRLMTQEQEEASRPLGPEFKSSPLHPQPVTVTLKFGNQRVVRVAALRVSERNLVDSFHVEGAGVLYNHLNNELDPRLLENMDVDRSVSSSIREVYKELMSRVSNKHLAFDQGPLVEPVSESDWSGLLFSASLQPDKRSAVINPALDGLYSKRVAALHTHSEKAPSLLAPQEDKSGLGKSKKGSWLAWWRNSISLDDYFRYLLGRETDFLHVIFQMYAEEAPPEPPAPVDKTLKILPPPPLLEDQEPSFVPGEWRRGAVLEYRARPRKTLFPGEPHKLGPLQRRLERLWSLLEVPHKDRMDMAVKYSSNARLRQLPSLLSAWERALPPIRQRESLLGKLERFERQASDPNRFFEKTDSGPSSFLDENLIRDRLSKKLGLVEATLLSLLREIESAFGEPVTFKGRRYLDKMKRDKVEMLYWLQQRRRARHLVQARAPSPAGLGKQLNSQALVVPGNSPVPP